MKLSFRSLKSFSISLLGNMSCHVARVGYGETQKTQETQFRETKKNRKKIHPLCLSTTSPPISIYTLHIGKDRHLPTPRQSFNVSFDIQSIGHIGNDVIKEQRIQRLEIYPLSCFSNWVPNGYQCVEFENDYIQCPTYATYSILTHMQHKGEVA